MYIAAAPVQVVPADIVAGQVPNATGWVVKNELNPVLAPL